ncbi:hypothetical protein [Pseudonocardia acidicola]|uniref:Uncharacterized protein n=1 Tax=Pseudonocardia acidicola TaxID=2724939 RepID=A0ABX1SAR4_9PSEU|nr:hypothetical protein [Pseudonocardia acidicola]NMH97952.1 hypothetical protein [Pseudonocardia acidicola]
MLALSLALAATLSGCAVRGAGQAGGSGSFTIRFEELVEQKSGGRSPILVPIGMELGVNLFVASGISRMSVLRVAKAALPSAAVLLGTLLLITFVPLISLALVG